VTTHEEWRVTGTPKRRRSEWVFSGEQFDNPEADARRLIANATAPCAWTDGPHLHKRTVTVTDWEDA
jgi:hypothetical protein